MGSINLMVSGTAAFRRRLAATREPLKPPPIIAIAGWETVTSVMSLSCIILHARLYYDSFRIQRQGCDATGRLHLN
ncbi:hypothetical protein [Microcystis sp. LE19-84.1B]|uniref:hypothetical protein n=1 Tax=Microcystis sp. LE19-84.1B TaxID=3016438 RepID=UPI002582FD92|nr:hypothetical protein [Microcystis sp. LE19-84.1B]